MGISSHVNLLSGGEFMLGVRVEISRYVDRSQPGRVECRLVDASGHEHVFVEKVPVVTRDSLDATSSYPQSGIIACIVLGRSKRSDGRLLVHIDTQTPWGVESTAGKSQFDAFAGQLLEFDSKEGAR